LGKTKDGKALRVLYVDAPFEPEKLGLELVEDGFRITGIFNDSLTSSYSDDLQSTTKNQGFIPDKK
jgi:hypothetical protein